MAAGTSDAPALTALLAAGARGPCDGPALDALAAAALREQVRRVPTDITALLAPPPSAAQARLRAQALALRYFRWLEGDDRWFAVAGATGRTPGARNISSRSCMLWLTEALLAMRADLGAWVAPHERELTTDAFPRLRLQGALRFASIPVAAMGTFEVLFTLDVLSWRVHDWRSPRDEAWFEQFSALLERLRRRGCVLCTYQPAAVEAAEPHRWYGPLRDPRSLAGAAGPDGTAGLAADPWAFLDGVSAEAAAAVPEPEALRGGGAGASPPPPPPPPPGETVGPPPDPDARVNVGPGYVFELRARLEGLERELHAAAQLQFLDPPRAPPAAVRAICNMLVERMEQLDPDTLQRGMRAYVARRIAVEADFLIAERRHPNVRGRDPTVTMLMKSDPLFSDLCGPRSAARAMAMSIHQPRVVDFFLDSWSRQILGESLEVALGLPVWRDAVCGGRRPSGRAPPVAVFWSPLHQCWAVALRGELSRLRAFRTMPQAVAWLLAPGAAGEPPPLSTAVTIGGDGRPRPVPLRLDALRETAASGEWTG